MSEVSRTAQALLDEFLEDPRFGTFVESVVQRTSQSPGPLEQLLNNAESVLRDPRSTRPQIALALVDLIDLAKGETRTSPPATPGGGGGG